MTVADDIYAQLEALHAARWGAAGVDPLRVLAEALGGTLQAADDIAGDDPWSAVGDPDRIPEGALRWLAQFVGVRATVGVSPAKQRDEIRQAAGWRRGTLPALIAAVKATLTGTRTVVVREQYVTAYGLRVETLLSETPDQAVTVAAIVAQKPAGLSLSYEAIAGQTWDMLDSDDWDTLAGDTWDDVQGV